MASYTLSKVTGVGGAGLSKWAPNLTAPTTWSSTNTAVPITGIDPSSGLTTVISIPDKKGVVNLLTFNSLIAEDYTIKLTIDGVVIFNGVWTISQTTAYFIGGVNGNLGAYDPCPFDESFLLEMQSTTDTSIGLSYKWRELL